MQIIEFWISDWGVAILLLSIPLIRHPRIFSDLYRLFGHRRTPQSRKR